MRLRFFAGLLGALTLVFVTVGAAAAATFTGTAALHSGGGGSCNGQSNGAGVGNIQYVLRGSQLTVTVNLQGASPNTTYDVFRRCVAAIGLISTNGAGNGSATFVVNGWSTNASIDLDIHGTNGAGHIGGDSMGYTQDTTPPVISNVPADITVPAQSANGAVVTYTNPTATDNVDGSVAVSCSPTSGSTFAIGATTVTCSASDTGGNTSTASFLVTVTKLDQTISFGALAGKTYGAAPFAVSASASSGLNVSFSASGNCSVSSATVTITGAGSCTITVSQAGDGTYNAASNVSQTFAIAIARTMTATSNVTATYGDATIALSATVSNIDTAAVVNEGTVTFSVVQPSADPIFPPLFSASATTNVSGGSASVTLGLNGANAGSYQIEAFYSSELNGNALDFGQSDDQATLTINKAASKTVVTVSSNVTYDAQPHPASATTTGVGGATIASPAVSYTPTSGVPTSAGNYTASARFDGNDNYLPSSDSQSYSIAKAPLGVKAADATRPYGTANPALTGTVTGIQGSDPITASYSTAATQSSGAGSYAIMPALSDGGSGALANYAATSTSGTLTVTPVPLTVTTNPSSKIYGAANPAFSVKYDGFVLSDAPASLGGTLSFTTAATTSSPVGNYDVTPGGLTSANYTISFVKGTLSVTPAKTASAASNATATYGDAGVSLSATVANSDTAAAVNEGAITFAVTQGSTTISSISGNVSGGSASATFGLSGVNAGSYTITAAYADGATPANYLGSTAAAATLTVNKAASKTVVTVPSNVTYDAQPHPASATTTGVGGATIASPAVTYTPGSGAPTQAGAYTASASFAGNGNYLPSSDSQSYGIAKATPTLAWANPADIIVGTPLSATQLNATASFQGNPLPGTFTYSPAAGTILARGSGQVLKVSFAATDGTDFNGATAQVTINVDYAFSFLPPLGANQQPFSAGQAIPVKFALTNAQGQQVRTAVATLAVDGTPVPGTFVVNGNHYQLNASTTGLALGQHTFTVSLDDGTTHSNVFTLVASTGTH